MTFQERVTGAFVWMLGMAVSETWSSGFLLRLGCAMTGAGVVFFTFGWNRNRGYEK